MRRVSNRDYKRLLFRDSNFVRRHVDCCSVTNFNFVGDDFLVKLPVVDLAFTHYDTDVLTRLRVVSESFDVAGFGSQVRATATDLRRYQSKQHEREQPF